MDNLNSDCIKYLNSIGSNSTKVSDIVNKKDPIVYKAIENGKISSFIAGQKNFNNYSLFIPFLAIKSINKKAVSRAANVQKFSVLSRDFSLPTGELGPSLKLRRPIIIKMYTSIIDDLYKETVGGSD